MLTVSELCGALRTIRQADDNTFSSLLDYAVRSEVCWGTLRKIETKQAVPSLQTWYKICSELQMPYATFEAATKKSKKIPRRPIKWTPESVGERIKKAREAAGLSTYKFWSTYKIGSGTLKNIEAGKANSSLNTIAEILGHLKLDWSDIFV